MLTAWVQDQPPAEDLPRMHGEYALRGDTHHRQGFLEVFGHPLIVDPDLRFDRDLIILAFSNRSGSNHLAEMISGGPQIYGFREDLNREQVSFRARTHGVATLSEDLRFIEQHQAKPGAAFGIKASAEQIRLIYQTGMQRCFRRCRIIRSRRRDRIAQAVSLFVAQRTRQWSSQMQARDACLDYDLPALRRRLDSIQNMESALDLVLSTLDQPVCDIYYEDLCDTPAAVLAELSGFLGFPLERPKDRPRLQKQSSPEKTALVARFRAELAQGWGLAPGATPG
ncbi:MAG: Stf0 family sulfotransferase [Silicimonas sp.]|nr:Stf0 family sulfotransferase [Silicimonas sp.]